MPYAEDYDAAAAAFDTAAQTMHAPVEPARAIISETVMVGGALSAVVTDELDSAGALLNGVTAELNELATTCRERADVCRQSLTGQLEYDTSYSNYETDLRRWQAERDAYAAGSAVPNPGPPPQPPLSPPTAPPWANH